MKDLFYLFIAFFLFFLSVYNSYSYISDRRKIKRIFRSRRKAMNRRKKNSNYYRTILTFNK
ncbi:TPA: small membrane protein [Klebsiella pneumoniae]|nr:small membrane protein [Klebsiella pneumoniae]EKZ9920927.1 small membrane protein [Klebsiella pneumoniae]ELA1630476.1 small membrane protein [Klebsiella pneumoniae]KAB0309775.1 small membrane protein [Klebsiella pneumoniae]MCB3696562.1 small membrane protein [Klebsiella pneumoniae]MCB3706868.1 small membrane protein [Klebsiella pneumoniae]